MSDLNQIFIFDRAVVKRHRERAAAFFTKHGCLFEESAQQLAERLQDIRRKFSSVLHMGRDSFMLPFLQQQGATQIINADLSYNMLQPISGAAVVADEELLPFAASSFDLVLSNLGLHWVNDLPGTLVQIRNALKPQGLFLGAMLGGQTLHELRSCLMEAELKVTGGVSPRLSPTIDLPTASTLLQRAGFHLPVADQERITLTYPNMFSLLHDLRGMGETNAHRQRLRFPTPRAVLLEAANLYQCRYPAVMGGISATFELIFLHGWRD